MSHSGAVLELPIDAILPQIVTAVRERGSLVLEAPPGAGKTTRAPRALLDVTDGQVVVLEPRRLAARLAAQRVASELGERVGERIGYQVRFENVTSPKTRLRFVTQGVLARQLIGDPELRGVGAVVLDEFHERQLEGDLALAMARRLQRGARRDLKIVVMSATLDAAPIAEYLGAPRLRAEGRRFDVAIDHLERPDERALDVQVAQASARLVREGLEGDVLVFLPGAAEIRRAQSACAELAQRAGLVVLPLYGDLAPAEQDRALAPAPAGKRKVILSTNVAETSLTIEGIVAVVDSGWARIASHAPWSGLPMLRLAKISRASAAQRAGRAGRTQPGRCLRLYTKHDHDTRPEHELPEIRRLDLAETMLALRSAGVGDVGAFDWLDRPEPAALEHAEELLERLGAFDRSGQVTPLGRRMLRFPLHPRQARIVCEAEARGVAEEGCQVAALLGERGMRSGGDGHGRSDLLAALGDSNTRSKIDRPFKQLLRLSERGAKPAGNPEDATLISILAGYPDRVARRRGPRSRDVVLASGGGARLSDASVVREAELLVAIDAEEKREAGRPGAQLIVHTASEIEPEWLADLFPDALRETDELRWQGERVEAVRRVMYDQLALEERTGPPRDAEAAARLLCEAARARGIGNLWDAGEVDRLVARLEFAGFAPDVDAALTALCQGRTSLTDLRDASLTGALLDALDGKQRAQLDRLAPDRITLPGGRSTRIQYDRGKPPSLESRLQDFFGMADGPRVGNGVPVVLHLLAPNQRAVQVTTDLAGFWERHYPQIRRELMRKYPKHAWPEDPRHAQPPAAGHRRR